MENTEQIDISAINEKKADPQTLEASSTEAITFDDLGLDEATLTAVKAKGFETPSPIQVLAIPRLLNGDANVIAKARTGTGKTAAFGLPLVQKIRSDAGHLQALILTPTRELALQVCREVESLSTGTYPRLTPVYGGQSMGEQLRALKRGTEIVVGTPGRVMDHLSRGSLVLDKIDYFILDEADEMLDMGFIEDIESIFSQANPNSRILLFSATMPPEILKIASKFMGDYEIVEEEQRPEEPILTEQQYWVVRGSEKTEALVRMIDISPDFYGLVFTQTKAEADNVTRQLDERGYEVAALHGDIAQNQREKILSRFRSKKTRILVATDVAARGIDIEGLSHVVNYDLPFDGPTYIHRIGRTGRAGAKGLAFTLVRPEERRRVEYLRSIARKATKSELKEAQIPSIDEVLAVKRERLFDALKESLGIIENKEAAPEGGAANTNALSVEPVAGENSATQAQSAEVSEAVTTEASAVAEENAVVTEASAATEENAIKYLKVPKEFQQMAKELCKGHDAENLLAAVLQRMYGKELDKKRYGSVSAFGNGSSSNRGGSSSSQLRLFVQLGRRDGFNAREIASYFSDLMHIQPRMVDRIDVSENFSLVSLPMRAGKEVLELSRKDRSLPHMHVDEKEPGNVAALRDFMNGGSGENTYGGRRGGGRGRSSGGGRGFGGGRGGRRDFGDEHGDHGRGEGGRYGKPSSGYRGKRSSEGGSNYRPSRAAQGSKAGMYKKQG